MTAAQLRSLTIKSHCPADAPVFFESAGQIIPVTGGTMIDGCLVLVCHDLIAKTVAGNRVESDPDLDTRPDCDPRNRDSQRSVVGLGPAPVS